MSAEAAMQYREAANYHGKAQEACAKAAAAYETGDYEKAGHYAQVAAAHSLNAGEACAEGTQAHLDDHGEE